MSAKTTDHDLDAWAQTAVILELLDRSAPIPQPVLHHAIVDVTDARIGRAVLSLQDAGVLLVESDGLSASKALIRLDELGMIAV
jgi:hypothetical protein